MLCLTSVVLVSCVAIEAMSRSCLPNVFLVVSIALVRIHYRILQWLPGVFPQLTPDKLAFSSLEAVLTLKLQGLGLERENSRHALQRGTVPYSTQPTRDLLQQA